MNTREALVAAALKVIEQDGEDQFSTRAVCAIADVTAPTLYHHFGNADGLLSAAMAEAFAQFLRSKKAAIRSSDPITALGQGWDNYVSFAAARPRLYAAMMARVLKGGHIAAAAEGNAQLRSRVEAIAATGRLAVTVEAAVDLVWASANAAALLHLTALLNSVAPPAPAVIDSLREQVMRAVVKSASKGKSK
jgi:AcrR family transcriptional regulator